MIKKIANTRKSTEKWPKTLTMFNVNVSKSCNGSWNQLKIIQNAYKTNEIGYNYVKKTRLFEWAKFNKNKYWRWMNLVIIETKQKATKQNLRQEMLQQANPGKQ